MSADLLGTIVAATRRIVEVREQRESRCRFSATGWPVSAPVRPPLEAGFSRRSSRRDRLNVIAECKRRSPSRGVLRADYDPATIAPAMPPPARPRFRC